MKVWPNVTQKTFQLPENPALIVASDIHIRTEHDERYIMLCKLVETAQIVGAKSFVLNGDIFDFFFGWGQYFRKKYSRLLSALDDLSKSGAQVWFVEGNHEFGLAALNLHHGFEVVPSEGRVWIGPQGHRILIAHGDLLRPDFKYELFRNVMRSRLINILALAFPQRLLDRLTLWFATTSRKKDKYRVLNHDRITEFARRRLSEFKADSIIFGHFHHPYDEDLGEGRRLLSVASWDQPSCLVMDAHGVITRIHPQ
jgi:UDP-2,3-diacylglucosamine hydrolase